MGVDVIEKLPAKDVDRIEITYYNPENGAENYDSYIAQKTFTDTADIEKILDSLVVCDSAYQESLNEDDNITAFIYMKDDKENAYGGYTSYRFKKGNVPDIVK